MHACLRKQSFRTTTYAKPNKLSKPILPCVLYLGHIFIEGRKSVSQNPQGYWVKDYVYLKEKKDTNCGPPYWVNFFFCFNFLLYFFPFIFISWRLITLQYCSGFCHTLTWISYGFTCNPHLNPPSESIFLSWPFWPIWGELLIVVWSAFL